MPIPALRFQAPAIRVTQLNDKAVTFDGHYVLYWMTSARRTQYNFALQHAIARCLELGKPLLVYEALRCDYQWASDRLHSFVINGMADNAAAFSHAKVTYLPYVEPSLKAGAGMLAALSSHAVEVITDEFPCFFLPAMASAAATKVACSMLSVDSNGILPLRAFDKAYPTAASFRRAWQKIIHPHLVHFPLASPLAANAAIAKVIGGAQIPAAVTKRWPTISADTLLRPAELLASLPIDHNVQPAFAGGAKAAHAVLATFLDQKLARYGVERNQPEQDVASGLSPFLHFGHISAHQVVSAVWSHSDWDPSRVAGAKATGSRDGWWGLPGPAESFMDEILTWRELGYSFCFHRKDFDQYSSLPDWVRKTLDEHASDPREHLYDLSALESAQTHDPLWNAAQRQLVREGRIHNYLRMLWGKKILQWTASPQHALRIMIELNNKYAVDGRNPNSYSGIFWTLGRFDRPWAPIRPVFGCIRFMSSDNTAKKLRVKGYLAKYAA
jgi:deoxyribodipyrimidine photo-lyase